MSDEHLTLKWGVVKGWDLKSDASLSAIKKYGDLGMSMSAMTQPNTPSHKAALCELIDAIDGTITNDWTGEEMTKDAAKTYVMEYGQ